MRGTRGVVPLTVWLLSMCLTGCQEPGQAGPMERTGVYIDHKIGDAQRGVADFSQRAGQSLDQAGRSIGAGAQRVGTTLHDSLMPATDATNPSTVPAADGTNPSTAAASTSRSLVPTNANNPSEGLPKPTPLAP